MWDSMLGKGFKAQKCKTLLRLAMARIKLLRNKREIQLKQMRKEISQLLTSGQEPSARIRVEHIIREQNILAAYDIIELFCELVAVRLPIIESQKNCPLDLKEAISSLIFASPRCSDLPELLQIRQLFAAKYGKEFAAAAAELRPDCGVNRRIIEKLSVRAPSGEVKLKLMKEIATEYDVGWDPADTEEELLKSHEDLLDGPSHFLGANEPPSSLLSGLQSNEASEAENDVPIITMSQMPVDWDGLDSSDSPSKDEKKRAVPSRNIPPPTTYQYGPPSPTVPPVRKVGAADQTLHRERQDTSSDTYVPSKKDEQGDYSDVASAAQAAAEAADRAVAAARAAASLASKHSGDHSSKLPEKTRSPPPEEEESVTDLDSDDDDARPVSVLTSGLRRRPVPETRKPLPASANYSDSDSETEEYDVPRGRGAGGTKSRSKSAYERSKTPEPYGKQKPSMKATKLDFQTSETSSKPAFDSDDDGEGSVLFRSGKQERDNRGNTTPGSKGGGLKWTSKNDSERHVPRDSGDRYDIFDANSDKSALRYSAFDSGDHRYGKKDADYDASRPDDTYDQPFAAKKYSSKAVSKSREGSPLFDEEGSVGRSRETSRFGSVQRTSHYDDEDDNDASLFSGTHKYGSDDYRSHRDPSPKTVDEDDLHVRFEALKQPRGW